MKVQPLFDAVVDASVGIKLFLDEPLSEEAHRLFAGLVADPPQRLYVPDLFYIECANILWKHVERAGLSAGAATAFMADLGSLALQGTPTAALAEDALEIALAHHITAYDAAYVALAARLDLPLVTADARLAAALPESVCTVQVLGV
jgi:predicted nucleic acid-binding protein